MQRMQTEAQELEAEGIVRVSLSERSHGWGSHVIEFFALGTAIVATGEGAKIEPPVTVLDLNDRVSPARSRIVMQNLPIHARARGRGNLFTPGMRSMPRPVRSAAIGKFCRCGPEDRFFGRLDLPGTSMQVSDRAKGVRLRTSIQVL